MHFRGKEGFLFENKYFGATTSVIIWRRVNVDIPPFLYSHAYLSFFRCAQLSLTFFNNCTLLTFWDTLANLAEEVSLLQSEILVQTRLSYISNTLVFQLYPVVPASSSIAPLYILRENRMVLMDSISGFHIQQGSN